MLKAPALLATLALAYPALGEPVESPAPAPERTPEQVQAEAAEIMAAAEVHAAAPLAPDAAPLDRGLTGVEDEAYLAGLRARLQRRDLHALTLPAWAMNPPGLGPIVDSAEAVELSLASTGSADPVSLSREGLGWLIGGSNTRLTLHAAYIRGAAGDPNSRTPIPTVAEPFDLSPSAARRQFVLTLQAQFVF